MIIDKSQFTSFGSIQLETDNTKAYISVNRERLTELKDALKTVASDYEWKIDFRNKVIRNFLIKVNNKDLMERYLQGEIDDDAFESEFNQHPEKYLISYNGTAGKNEVIELLTILKNNLDVANLDLSDAQDLISAKIDNSHWISHGL